MKRDLVSLSATPGFSEEGGAVAPVGGVKHSVASKDDDVTAPPVSPVPARRKPIKKDGNPIGGALRAAYQDAADEAIPQEMLDLLGRLS